jgi:hypothetical protein
LTAFDEHKVEGWTKDRLEAFVVSRSRAVGIAELLPHERKRGILDADANSNLDESRIVLLALCRSEGGSDMLARNGKDAGNN